MGGVPCAFREGRPRFLVVMGEEISSIASFDGLFVLPFVGGRPLLGVPEEGAGDGEDSG